MLKRKLSAKTLNEKCKALKEVEKGLSNKDASKKRKLRESDLEKLDNVVFRWFLSRRSQNILIDGNLIKEKAITFAKELGYNNFHGSAGWLDRWKKKVND